MVVVNERFVEQYVPDGSAVGRRIRFGGLESDDPWREIVGVVPNYRIEGTGSADPGAETDLAGMYLPLAQYDLRAVSVAATTAGVAPLSITAGVRDAVIAADAETPIFSVQTIAEAIDRNTWFYRIFGNLFLAFGGAALFLASVGLYGVMSFGVNQRAGEMGIRMALGAESRQVLAMVMRQGFMQILIGVVAGSGIALLVARGLQQILFQVEPFDLTAFVGVFLLLAATGAAASFLPALRATRVDPMGALRKD